MGSIRRIKTKRRTRDLDQVKADLKSPRHLAQHKGLKAAEDLPGLGAFYCTECAKYFSDSHNLNEHRRGKNHKRRVRMLKEEAHTQRTADAAVGLGTDKRRSHAPEDDPVNEAMKDVER
ncbi:uncharacterized protein Z520_01400 [Fonsecaea multimorphosa CBS 102226]|uniref:C2H2-type domain-containing protein n=1 Tax=Fonsecaea multimorphosa CBS 102226 TaxID=1442371 RepID=A0A0D2KHN0_9EURO|nr:uncharacterized protein Z520_01400 [Fonsecaea multimorphosa CBS 102226]KIY02935.1 hypothetical protein Z520_01400 [Fonsecaea multimorphosa CBS 102226]OAL30768.1 hypothetical protein AYO22_01388 [Fonsecaea multimorphosa]